MVPLSADQISILDRSVLAILPEVQLGRLNGKSILITGGTGFFGSWLLSCLRVLNQRSIRINASVLSRNSIHFLARYPQFNNQPWLQFIKGDITSFQTQETTFDFLIHGATETSLAAHQDYMRMLETLFIGTRNVFRVAQSTGIKRALLISSGAVYGPSANSLLRQPEDTHSACYPLTAKNAYGEGKRIMELLGAIAYEQDGIEPIIARCFSFAGPCLPLDQHFAIGNFIRDALYRDEIIIHGDGSAVRSYLYGADLAIWLLKLLAYGEVCVPYNVGSDEPIDILSLAQRIGKLLAPTKPIVVLSKQDQEFLRPNYVPEISRGRLLGCKPWTSLDAAIDLSANFWRYELH